MARRIVVFGYSITQGYWDTEGGWVARLRKYLDKQSLSAGLQNYWQVYNLGISAETLDRLVERIEDEAERRIVRRSDFIILAPGVNDSKYIISQKKNVSSPSSFKNNIGKLIDKAKRLSQNVIFVGPTPVDESRTNPWKPDEVYKNQYIKEFNKIIKSVCNKKKINFVELYNNFYERKGFENLLQDGLHPNNKGHKFIFNTVKQFLINKNYI